MTNTLTRLVFSVAVLWALGLGCGPRAAEPTRLMAKQRAPVSDLPVPMGFRILEDESEDAYTGRRRIYLRHLYVGSGEPFAVRNFYRDRMPQYQWQLVNSVHVAGTHSMVFQKGQESCTVAISRSKSGWKSGIRVQIIIMPEERGAQADTRGQ